MKLKKLIPILLTLIFLILLTYKYILKEPIKESEVFLASETNNVEIYDLKYNKIMEIPRGTKVLNIGKQDDYQKIKYDGKIYLVKNENINEKIVLEETIYVRTPCILYKNETDSDIITSLKKGTKLEIIGYDYLKDGIVNMYQVKYEEEVGYVYGKYLDQNEEKANSNYDNGYFEEHLKRVDTLGGGDAASLDYYPYEKPEFEDNVMPDEVKSLYINSAAIKNIDEYIKIAKQTNINAFTVDIKDNESPAYKSEVMKKLSPTNYENAKLTIEEYQKAIKKIKDNNFYVIGRITTFKDDYYALDNYSSTIYNKETNEPFLYNGSYWPSPFIRDVWYFNVELAKEAINLMGFNEIQFDYVRFPDRTSSIEKKLDYKNNYKETKAEAIQQFVMYACDEIHKLNAYVSIDVFAESAHPYVTSYGQYFPAISNIADVISPMAYPDHFNKYEYGIKEPVWTVPYELLNYWAENYVSKRQQETTTPAVVRTWIQTYDTIQKPYITYDSKKIEEQIKGLYNAGLKDGYITWNSSSSLAKYENITEALNKNYKE